MNKELIPALSAVLFAGGEPQIIDRLCEVFEIKEEELAKAVAVLNDQLKDLGLRVVKLGNTYQMATQIKYADPIKKAFDINRKAPLSSAAFEVLAVVAYKHLLNRFVVLIVPALFQLLLKKSLSKSREDLIYPVDPFFMAQPITF